MSGTVLPTATTTTAAAGTAATPAWLTYFASKQPAAGTQISRAHRLALVRLYIAILNVECGPDHSVDAGQPAPSTVTPAASTGAASNGSSGTDSSVASTSADTSATS